MTAEDEKETVENELGSDDESFEDVEPEDNERNSFVKEYKHNASQDDTQVNDFITKLFMKLHAIYGKGTAVIQNEFGGYDFFDGQTLELVNDFNNYRIQHAALDFSDICDYILNRNPLVAVSFAAVSSEIFKEDLNQVYQLADKTFKQ